MFENSLVVSQINRTSSIQRWTAFASMGLQIAVVFLLVALPLLHPERLAFQMGAPRLLTPLPQKPPVPTERVRASSTASSTAASITTQQRTAPSVLTNLLPRQNDEAPSVSPLPFAMGANDGVPKGLETGDANSDRHIAVVATHPTSGPVRVSSGVSAGRLIAPIRPIYPNIARIARVEGTVVVEAIISRSGTISSLRIVSGPAMLRQAALDAVGAARYQPFQLNGSPTEVQTTISVNFRLGN
jgi:protein TonB